MDVIEYEGQEWKVPRRHYSSDPDEAVFFYGGDFSNFVGGAFRIIYPQPWLFDDPATFYKAHYLTVEHFFQASKAHNYIDHEHVRNQTSPHDAKRAGRRIDLRQDWEAVKFDVMLVGLKVKFSLDYFRQTLLATGNRLIAEDSPYDFEWGIRDSQRGYTGNNMLGKSLMTVRQEIRKAMGYE